MNSKVQSSLRFYRMFEILRSIQVITRYQMCSLNLTTTFQYQQLFDYGKGSMRLVQISRVMQEDGIKSEVTLQRLRDEGKIRYSHPEKKIFLYDRGSQVRRKSVTANI